MPPLILIVLLILVTTARHEASHAVAAWLVGGDLLEVRLLPGYRADLGFYFGYVSYQGQSSPWVDAAPFLVAVACFGFVFLLLRTRPVNGWLRWGLFWFGLVSPLADLAYNYQSGLWREGSDVADLLQAWPPVGVHAFFLLTLGLGFLGLRSLMTMPAEHSTGDVT